MLGRRIEPHYHPAKAVAHLPIKMKNVLYAAVSLLFVACGGEDEASNEDVELKEEMYHEESDPNEPS
jgi:hypothetical protein